MTLFYTSESLIVIFYAAMFFLFQIEMIHNIFDYTRLVSFSITSFSSVCLKFHMASICSSNLSKHFETTLPVTSKYIIHHSWKTTVKVVSCYVTNMAVITEKRT